MASYALALPGFEGRRVFLKTAGIVSGPKVLVGDAVAPRGKRRGTFSLRKNDGTLAEVRLKHRVLDPVPIVEFDGRQIEVVRPLRWYEYIWMALPILLLHGGALGALFGIGAIHISSRIIRTERSAWVRYASTGLVAVWAVGAFLIAATLTQRWLGR